MKKKISFMIGKMSGGGAERVISALANNFVSMGYDVSIIAIIEDDISYDLDPRIKYIANNAKYINKVIRVLNRYKFTRRILKEQNPDVIISFTTEINIYSILANLFLGKEIIVSERNDPYNDPPSKFTRFIRDITYNFANKFVFQTPDAKKYFSKSIQKRSIIIVNPIKNNLPLRHTGVRKREIVTVARLSKQKNLKMLIDAFLILKKEYPDFILKIYGDGPEKNELERYILDKNAKESVKLIGYVKDVHIQILDATAFVLPSNYEGISNAMLEALAIGVPTICTNCPAGGAKMFIRPFWNGLLIDVGDTNGLYKAMKLLIENKELAEKMSANSISIRDELSVEKICQEWNGLLS